MTTQSPTSFDIDCVEAVDAPRSRPRMHARLQTMITVTEGVLYVITDEDDHVLTPGETVVIPAGTTYTRFNAGDDEARFLESYREVREELADAA